MSFEVKRVPLDLDLKIGEVWTGYLNPHAAAIVCCPCCHGRGDSKAGKRLHDQWYGKTDFDPISHGSKLLTATTPGVRAFAERNCSHSPGFYGDSEADIVREANRLVGHWQACWSHHPGPRDLAALQAADEMPKNCTTLDDLQNYAITDFGGLPMGTLYQAEAKHLGIETTCYACKGEGHFFESAEHKAAYDAWEPSIPEGPGYVMFETVSEGSPITPIFATATELANWCAVGAPWGTRRTAAQWLKFIEGPGWVPSAIFTPEKGFQTAADLVGAD